MFGDLDDPRAGSRTLTQVDRGYTLLAELYTKPRTRYLARSATRTPACGGASRPATSD